MGKFEKFHIPLDKFFLSNLQVKFAELYFYVIHNIILQNFFECQENLHGISSQKIFGEKQLKKRDMNNVIC